MLVIRNFRIFIGFIFFAFGFLNAFMGLTTGDMETFFTGSIWGAVGYYMAFYLEKTKKKNAIKEIEKLTNEKVVEVMPATYRNEANVLGFLAVTPSAIVFNRKGENFLFPFSTISTIGTTTEGTGQFISTVQRHGYSNKISTYEVKKMLFYLEGNKNNASYLEYFNCNDIWWGSRRLNKFYKVVSKTGEFSSSSSLNIHKA